MADWNIKESERIDYRIFLSTTYGRLKHCRCRHCLELCLAFYYLWQIETAPPAAVPKIIQGLSTTYGRLKLQSSQCYCARSIFLLPMADWNLPGKRNCGTGIATFYYLWQIETPTNPLAGLILHHSFYYLWQIETKNTSVSTPSVPSFLLPMADWNIAVRISVAGIVRAFYYLWQIETDWWPRHRRTRLTFYYLWQIET